MAQGGAGVYRRSFDWNAVEPTPGARNWNRYDKLVSEAGQAGIGVLPVILSSPAFAAKVPGFPPRPAAQPAYAAFVRDLVGRYGRDGTFWRTHRGRAITAWQVWNEPNFPAYWTNRRPSARGYVALLKRTRVAIKSRDPRATIVMAGLPESKHGVPIARYLQDIYEVRGARRLFDVVAVHPYAVNVSGIDGTLGRVREIMRRHGDAGKPIWLTEVGWASAGPPSSPFVSTPQGQAQLLRDAYDILAKRRVRDHLGLVAWFSWRDRALAPGEKDWWAPHTGLFDAAGRAKPVWQAFTELAGGKPGSGGLGPVGAGG
jgi:polysaccharide biosynthesis protein PslG